MAHDDCRAQSEVVAVDWLIVDVEASAPGALGYPVEIAWGLVGASGGTAALIRPRPQWQVPGSWSLQSQAIHGIDPAVLRRHGLDADRVAAAFLEASARCRVLSDMPCLDGPWLAGLTGRQVALHDFWEQVRMQPGHVPEAQAVEEVDVAFPARHRAAADVRRLRWLWERIVGDRPLA
jgi:hypothetical protein